MSSSRPPVRPVVFVALDAARPPLPAALEAGCTRGRMQLESFDVISGPALANNQVLRGVLRKTKANGGRLHLFGLVSDGGVCSSFAHLLALIEAAKSAAVRVVVHAFLDGMDVAVGSAPEYIARLEAALDGGVGRIGTVSGRTWGMAPEGRWDRIEKVYRAVTADNVDRVDSALRGIEQACQFGVPEQFVAPFVVFDYPGASLVDSALHFNFAAEGARELTLALAAPDFRRFTRAGGRAPFAGRFSSMTPVDSSLDLPTLFPRAPDLSELPLDVLQAAGYGARRIEQGSAPEIAKGTAEALQSGQCAFVLADLTSPANSACSRAEALERALGQIVEAARAAGGSVMVVGGRDGKGDSAALAYLGEGTGSVRLREDARAGDLAPTLLELFQLSRPAEIEGASLLVW